MSLRRHWRPPRWIDRRRLRRAGMANCESGQPDPWLVRRRAEVASGLWALAAITTVRHDEDRSLEDVATTWTAVGHRGADGGGRGNRDRDCWRGEPAPAEQGSREGGRRTAGSRRAGTASSACLSGAAAAAGVPGSAAAGAA